MNTEGKIWNCIEWFSGIGGMHYALQMSECPVKVVASFDINQIANEVYYHNFHRLPITKNIEYLTADYIDSFNADIWLMSPPCQPFTQGGKQRDDKDMRSKGLLHLIHELNQLKHPPKFIFLENVPFFETSNCHHLLVEKLKECNFEVEEYMISPTDPIIRIPNRRKRYYLSARHRSLLKEYTLKYPFISDRLVCSLADLSLSPVPEEEARSLVSYIRSEADVDPQYQVPLPFIQSAKNFKFDIVQPTSSSCATFTKAYGSKYVIGTGSFLQTKHMDVAYEMDDQQILPSLGLRFFSPLEIADLQALPVHDVSVVDPVKQTVSLFQFPDSVSLIQKYRLLGNSLNVKVVAYLLKHLFTLESNHHFIE